MVTCHPVARPQVACLEFGRDNEPHQGMGKGMGRGMGMGMGVGVGVGMGRGRGRGMGIGMGTFCFVLFCFVLFCFVLCKTLRPGCTVPFWFYHWCFCEL